MEFECRNYRPYAQALRTLSLGCVNCGHPAFSHPGYCNDCYGTGRTKNEKGEWDDLTQCPKCIGTGRADGSLWNG